MISEHRRDAAPTCTGTLVHDEFTACPVHDRKDVSRDDVVACTGTLVHDEFTACPVHDWRDR